MTKSEEFILKSYLALPVRELLCHQMEMQEDIIAGRVSRFLKGEKFNELTNAFTKDESEMINRLITKNIETDQGKDLLVAYLVTKATCTILNKYTNL